MRVLQSAGAHVHISSGLRRIDHRRLRALPLAYEPLFYVEPWALPGRQLVVKRALDLAGSGLILIVAAPVLLLIAAPRSSCNDRGPVLFKQTRVGTNGELFKVYKFRTMVVDAEARLAALAAPERAHRARCSRWPRTPASPGSAASCGPPASTSSPSS